MAKYRKRPVVIDAVQWLPNEMLLQDVIELFGGLEVAGINSIAKKNGNVIIKTLEGEMTVSAGDYIIKGVKGEFYPCKPDIFEATYEVA